MNTYRRHVVAPDVREVAESRGGGEGGGGVGVAPSSRTEPATGKGSRSGGARILVAV